MPMEVVSGDFFYYGFLNEDKWFMYMVDVSGHGIPAALIASMAKSSFSSKIEKYKHHLSPSRILQEVNKDFLDLKGRGFLTACFIVYDAKQKKITYSNAGHTLPIYLPKEHSANIVYMKGVPLGIKENPVYRERILFLKPGDRVFFYTDGIIEVANEEGELFGEERLKHIIERERNLPLVAVVNMIITEYWLYNTKLYQEDDITLVAIEVL
jgi:sigma-B regulation protein RsbU (phosphoserine phosphatase)